MLLGYLSSTKVVAAVASLALLVAAPPPLPTFVPQGPPRPTAVSAGTGGGNAIATGGGILPAFALTVSFGLKINMGNMAIATLSNSDIISTTPTLNVNFYGLQFC